MINIYTDGACSQNVNSEAWTGGWGLYAEINGRKVIRRGNSANTTNNRMELEAFLAALQLSYPFIESDQVNIYTDSAYISNCFTQKWYVNWMKNGWKNAKKVPVKNKDLWEEIIRIYEKMNKSGNLKIIKVAGHSDNEGNIKADKIAVNAKDDAKIGEIYKIKEQ